MGEFDLKENSDKYTMKLPGKSVLLFILLASGVCVVYYFTNRTNDLQYNAGKKSDLVWLQNILNKHKDTISRHPTGHNRKHKTKPKHHFYDDDNAKGYDDVYNADDQIEIYDDDADADDNYLAGYDDDDTAGYDDHTEYVDYDSDIDRLSQRKHRVSTPASKSIAFRVNPEDAGKYVKKYRPKGDRFSHANSDENRDNSYAESGQTKLLSGLWSKDTKLNRDETRGESYPEVSNGKKKILSRDRFQQHKWTPTSGLQTKPTQVEYSKTTQSKEHNSSNKSNYVSTLTTDNLFIESESSDYVKGDFGARTQSSKTADGMSNAQAARRHWPLSNDAIVVNNPEKLKLPIGKYAVNSNQPIMRTTKAPITRTSHAFNLLKPRLSMVTFGREAKHQAIHMITGQPGANKNEKIDAKTDVAQDTSNIDIAEIKKNTYYPNFINVFDWNSRPTSSLQPQCVRMQTISYYVRICIHSITEDPDVSAGLKSQASWEFNSMRDVEIAVLEEKGTGLIDIGAGIGEYSLAVASLERHVVAVEPYRPHVDIFQSSVNLNKFEKYITLFRNGISDGNEWLSMEHRSGHISDVIFKTHTAQQISDDKVTRTITLNQMANSIPFKKAILKIDIPNYTKKALTESDKLFESVDIKYVLTHWDRNDVPLNQFLVQFFKKLGYQPYSQLHGLQLDFEKYEKWMYPYIVWAKK